MACNVEEPDRYTLLSIILKELSSTAKSPSYDYMKTELLSSKYNLLSALAAIHETNQTKTMDDLPQKKCDLLLNSDESEFYVLFKFKKDTMIDLIELLEHRLLTSEDEDGTPITVPTKVLVTCWLLTSAEEYYAASDVFNISVNTIQCVFLEVCTELTKLVAQFVTWPSEAEQLSAINEFETLYGFPGVIGVIGSTSFNINHPSLEKNENHINKSASDQHSIIIQAVCDHRMVFRDICVGVPSRRIPSEILRDSPLYAKLVSRTSPLLKPKTFILGSHDYPQLPNLLTPYAPEVRGRPLDETECNFNKFHSVIECLIHRCFDVLRTRFGKLNNINDYDPSKATPIILAACVLHNFALMRGDV